MTTYVILKRVNADNHDWLEGERIEARSDASALRQANLSDGVYVAVPARSWRPRTVKAEQTTKLTIT